jgi:hypothetical protein
MNLNDMVCKVHRTYKRANVKQKEFFAFAREIKKVLVFSKLCHKALQSAENFKIAHWSRIFHLNFSTIFILKVR